MNPESTRRRTNNNIILLDEAVETSGSDIIRFVLCEFISEAGERVRRAWGGRPTAAPRTMSLKQAVAVDVEEEEMCVS